MSYMMPAMGALGETSAELREVLYARGHAVRSKTECSAPQMESMAKLQEALSRTSGISDPPGTQEYQDTLRRVLYTYNETNRRCQGRWASEPLRTSTGTSQTTSNVQQASVFPTGTVLLLTLLGLGLAGGGYALYRYWQSR